MKRKEIKPVQIIVLFLISAALLLLSISFHNRFLYIISFPVVLVSLSVLLLTFISFPLGDLKYILKYNKPFRVFDFIKAYVLWMFILVFVTVIIYVGAFMLGLNDSKSVYEIISKQPLYVILYAILVAPVVEEIFFRLCLPSYIGGFLSTVVFAFAHLGYGSIFEIIGAFTLGYVLYLSLVTYKDIRLPIALHMTVNSISLILMFLTGGAI